MGVVCRPQTSGHNLAGGPESPFFTGQLGYFFLPSEVKTAQQPVMRSVHLFQGKKRHVYNTRHDAATQRKGVLPQK